MTTNENRTTIKDIARQIGVSHQVVSKVLHDGKSNIGASEALRKKIIAVAAQLSYRPHNASRSLRSQQFRSIGLLIGGVDSFYLTPKFVASFARKTTEAGYTITLVSIADFEGEEILKVQMLTQKMVDLLVVSYVNEYPVHVLDAMNLIGLPTVWLTRHTPNNAISLDETGATKLLVRHLASLGHTEATFVDFSFGGPNPLLSERLQGFDEAAAELGLTAKRIIGRMVSRPDRFGVLKDLLARPDRPRAIIANSISLAQMTLHTALHLGMRIPEDLAIVSYDQDGNNQASVPTITCATRSDVHFGTAAAEMALRKLKNPGVDLPSIDLGYDLFVGGTTVRMAYLGS